MFFISVQCDVGPILLCLRSREASCFPAAVYTDFVIREAVFELFVIMHFMFGALLF